MNLMLRCVLCAVPILFIACSKNAEQTTETPAAPTQTAAVESAAASPVDGNQTATTLAELTQAVRKYGAEKQRVPKDLSELVTAGYLPGIPSAPPGKKFAINKQMEVYLADQ